MEFVEENGVKVPNAVVVSGVTGTERDKEVYEFLEQHGSIYRTLTINDSSSELYGSQVVEFESGVAVKSLAPELPYLLSTDDPRVRYHIQALNDVYTRTIGGSFTETYLNDLKGLAKLSGKDFEEVLKEVMSTIGKSIESTLTTETDLENRTLDQINVMAEPNIVAEPSQSGVSPLHQTRVFSSPKPMKTILQSPPKPHIIPPTFTATDINPPEIQKIVVEHVVKNVGKISSTHAALRIRAFSGKTPRPYSEADYETWRSHVNLMIDDSSLSQLDKTRKILESLLSPASDVIRPLGPEATPADYIELLDSAFGAVEDGEELLVRFMNTLQDHGEKPSTYLHRLQVALSLAVRRGGLEPQEVNKQLLKQFNRGCWDDTLLTELQLELKNKDPPTYAELLLFLRTAENRQEVKSSRMKRHFSTTKPKAVSHEQTVIDANISVAAESSCLRELKKQVADLKSQLTAVMKQKKSATPKKTKGPEIKKPDHVKPKYLPSTSRQSTRPKPWYCFRCGEDGHIVATCESEPNAALVEAKRKELKARRQIWDSQNDPPPLN
nr:zinc finger CCHC domain-containing protein 12-like [Nothobranchius furzeri]